MPGEKRGKVWEPPAVVKPAVEDDEFLAPTEWDDVLTNASETEIVELAGSYSCVLSITIAPKVILCSYPRFHWLDQSSAIPRGSDREGHVDERRWLEWYDLRSRDSLHRLPFPPG